MTSEEFAQLLESPEGTNIEFKEAKNRFSFDDLVKYIVAIANEGGGRIVFGVTNKRPRTVVGTNAFSDPGQTESMIEQKIHRSVSIKEHNHDGKRALIVNVPARLPGTAWDYEGRYLRRSSDSLVGMSDRELRGILAETAPDFSDQLCPSASMADLDPKAIAFFRERWSGRSGNIRILSLGDEQILVDAGLVRNGAVTYAALTLLGKAEALDRLFPRAEIIIEYRSNESAGPAQDRVEFREGFLLVHDRLWEHLNLRNDRQSYQDGFFRREINTFDEQVAREAVLNAVCHRDYSLSGPIIVRQYARRLEIVSPGGFPAGVTIDNVLDQQAPRNYRLAEACLRCGLVERAGQGMNLMFERSIQQSKPLPDLHRSSEHLVFLTLEGTLNNLAFLKYLERVGQAKLQSLSTQDFLVLDRLQKDEDLTREQASNARRLVDLGILERIGRGRGVRFILSRSLYAAIDESGVYTRRKGLDRPEQKALLFQHIRENDAQGSRFRDLQQVTPSLNRDQVQTLLRELRAEGKIVSIGKTRGARWHVASAASE